MRPGRRLGSLRARLAVSVGIGIALGLATLGGLEAGFLNGYRLQATDALQPTGSAEDRIVVVAIDHRALLDSGERWPWPWSLHAELIRRLEGAQAIVYDITFSLEAEGDDELAAAIDESRNVVLAGFGVLQAPDKDRLWKIENLDLPVEELARRSDVGHANVTPDSDGVVRSVPLVVETADGDLVPSLALATLIGEGGPDQPLTIRPQTLIVGDRAIATGRAATLDIAFAPELDVEEQSAAIVSAADVFSGEVKRSRFEDKIVLVGVTDPALGDNRQTPVAKDVEMPGVLIHANALNTMLTENYLRPVGHARVALAAGGLGAFIALVTLAAPVVLAPIVALLTLAAYVIWSLIQFDAGTVLDLIYPPLAMLVAFVAALSVKYFTELRARRRVAALFSQYVPRGVADNLIAAGRVDDAIRGERLLVTALFCDLRGFTATSARLEAAQVRDLLNVYYEETVRIIHELGGTVLNYVGDEVFAAWGAPMPDPDGASKGVKCARRMQEAAEAINQRLIDAGLEPIAYGIGMHTGEVIAAHVGSDVHRQYTMVGDTINCASRLCTIAGRREIVVSAETYNALLDGDGKPPAQVLPGISLKGVGRDLLPHRLWPDEFRDPTGQDRQGKIEA